jgi:hypothetical protein
MDFKRWYPTTTKLPDGDVLIFSGWRYEFPPGSDRYDPDFIEAVERFDSETNSMARLQRSANKGNRSLSAHASDAERQFVSRGPRGRHAVLRPGHGPPGRLGCDELRIPKPRIVSAVARPNRGTGLGGSKHHGATKTAEIIDLSAAGPSWRTTQPKREYGRPVKAAELFDPLTETWTTVAAQRAPRAYHSTAVLLPDGRVLSAGHDNGRRSTMAEVYSPPYLFRGPARPSPRRSTV